MKPFPLIILSLFFLNGCGTNKSNAYEHYLTLLPPQPGSEIDQRIDNFIKLYNHLEKNSVARETKNTYAESIYFNDTLVTINNRQELIKYLEQTQQQIQSLSFSVLNVFEKDNDLLVQWKMRTEFEILGQQSDIETIGISHLRFDQHGKITLHQDYWDSTHGFFQHIPMIGGILQWIKNGLH